MSGIVRIRGGKMVQIIRPQNWELSQYDRGLPDHTRPEAVHDRFGASVPGCVHSI